MSVASAIYQETCNVCEVISKFLGKTLKTIIQNRQLAANRIVAQQLIDLGEFRGMSVRDLISELNSRTMAEWK
jgi:hypothetical protein